MITPEQFNQRGAGHLPGHLGIVITEVADGRLCAELEVKPFLMAPNGYLHAGAVVTLADTAAGYGCVANLPEGATGFTTIELKSNHLGTAREGVIACVATAVHLGRTTQVWDAIVTRKDSGKVIAMFRCTQMVLYPQAAQ
jgi:1,4-dihydroxy-2-naphthoyl-CoA hydrolase